MRIGLDKRQLILWYHLFCVEKGCRELFERPPVHINLWHSFSDPFLPLPGSRCAWEIKHC